MSEEKLFSYLKEASNEAPAQSATITTQIDQFKQITEDVLSGQADLLSAIEDLETLTNSLVASSDEFGDLLFTAELIETQLRRTAKSLLVSYERADTAAKIIQAILQGRSEDIKVALDRFSLALKQGIEGYRLFKAGATIPIGLFGFGKPGYNDLRQPGANPFPPAPQFTFPPEGPIE